MKAKMFIVILSLNYHYSYEQHPILFLDTTNQWVAYFYSPNRIPSECYEGFSYKSDTVINHFKYQKFYYKDTVYQGAMRLDSLGNILYIGKYNACSFDAKYGSSTNDIILYNFNLNVGDSIVNYLEPYGRVKVVIEKVDSMDIYGQKRKILKVRATYGNHPDYLVGNTDVWVEGIGSIRTPLYPIIFSAFEWYWRMNCFSNSRYFQYGSNCITPSKNISYVSLIKIFPNPVSDQLFILLNENIATELKEIKIVNVTGAFVKTIPSTKLNIYQIDVDGLVNGVYFIWFSFADGQGVKKIVVNH